MSEANGPAPSTGERSAGDLVKDISELVPQLVSGAVAAWRAALIVGVALLAVSAGAGLAGAGRLPRATPPVSEQAGSNVQADVREIREKAQR